MAKAKPLLLNCKKNTYTFFNMDEDKSSFLYLPSNVASQRYVSNTLSHFKIPLAKPLNFCDPHNWEVRLSELYFPSSYYTISQDNNSKLTIQYHIKVVYIQKILPSHRAIMIQLCERSKQRNKKSQKQIHSH